jgi:hypothetical protein
MTLPEILQSIATGGTAGALVGWLVQHFLAERLRAGIQHEYATRLESHKALLQADLARALESIRSDLAERQRLNRERWDLKREACLAALSVVDKVLTHIPWEDRTKPGAQLRVARLRVDPSEARDAMNRLILACDDPTVVHLFLKCIGLQDSGEAADAIDPAEVQDLRNSIRRELGFGTDLQLNPNLSWIISVHGDGVDTDSERRAEQQGDAAADAVHRR